VIKIVLESCIKPFTIPTAAEIATINRIPKINASTNLIPPLKLKIILEAYKIKKDRKTTTYRRRSNK